MASTSTTFPGTHNPRQYNLNEVIKLCEQRLDITKTKSIPSSKRQYQALFPNTKELKLTLKQEAFILSAILVEISWGAFNQKRLESCEQIPVDYENKQIWSIKHLVPTEQRPLLLAKILEVRDMHGSGALQGLSSFLNPVRNWEQFKHNDDFQNILLRARKLYRKNTGLLGFRRDIVQSKNPLKSIEKGFDTADLRFSRLLGLCLDTNKQQINDQHLRRSAIKQLHEFRVLAHTATAVEARVAKSYRRARGRTNDGETTKFNEYQVQGILNAVDGPSVPLSYSKKGHSSIGCSALYAEGSFPISMLSDNHDRPVFDEYFEWYYNAAQAIANPELAKLALE